jgi:iron complex outermembrane receptor protein
MDESLPIGYRRFICIMAGCLGIAAPCLQAVAVDSAEDSLGEIIVTAERRSENLQNVPIAVTAFTADTLQMHNLNDVQSLGNLTPGLNLDAGAPFSGDRSVLSASIRGIGQDDFAFNLNPGVGVYLDGVYLARTIGANQNLLDVDRIEVLKGPQGTLFGANTIGGAISIVTHTPGNEEKVTVQVTGGSYNRRDVSLTADIPIVNDTLLSTISVSSQNQTGWMKAIPYPTNSVYGEAPFVVDPQNVYPKAGYQTSDNYDGTGVFTVRGKLLWKPTDKLSVTFSGDWSHEDQTALGYTVLDTYYGNVNYSTFSTLYNLCISNGPSTILGAIAGAGGPPPFIVGVVPGVPDFALACTKPRAKIPGLSIGGAPLLGAGYVGGPPGPYNYATYLTNPSAYLGTQQPRIWYGLAATQTGNIDSTYANGPDFARNDLFGFSANAVYEIADNMTFKSITGYRQIKWNIGTDLDGTPETIQEVTDAQHQWQISQEFQLLGKEFDSKLNYVAGLYYFKEAGYVHDFVPFESILFVDDLANDVTNDNYAAFAHLDYRLDDHWGFTAGGRYTDWQTYFLGGQADLNDFPFIGANGLPTSANVINRYFPNIPDSQAWHIFDPTLGVQYHFDNDVMAYLTWGKGFKAGGWTTRLSAVITSPKQAEFAPEYSKTWELGLKSQWFENRLRANVAVFYTDYDGIQLNIQQGISPVYTNAGNAKIKGGEFELQSVVSHGLTLNLAGSYIDAYYTYVNPYANIPQILLPDGANECPAGGLVGEATHPVCAVVPPGSSQLGAKLPKTPKYKISLYPQYDIHLANDGTLRSIVDFTYTAMMYNDALNTPELRRPATRMLNASMHYLSPSGRYDTAIGGTNLTDDRFITGGSPNAGAGEVGGYYNPPREWYVSVQAKFGR